MITNYISIVTYDYIMKQNKYRRVLDEDKKCHFSLKKHIKTYFFEILLNLLTLININISQPNME